MSIPAPIAPITKLKVVRNPSGKGGWKKGISGNPKGRPKGRGGRYIPTDLQALARQYTAEAFGKVVEIMRDEDTPPNAVLTCVQIIFERGYGTPFKTEQKSDGEVFDIERLTIEELDALGARTAAAIESVKSAGGDSPPEGDAGGETPRAA